MSISLVDEVGEESQSPYLLEYSPPQSFTCHVLPLIQKYSNQKTKGLRLVSLFRYKSTQTASGADVECIAR
jgi:hypothetical protein